MPSGFVKVESGGADEWIFNVVVSALSASMFSTRNLKFEIFLKGIFKRSKITKKLKS